MEWNSFYPLLRSVWVVWFMALYLGILAWAFWPARKEKLENLGQIPLRKDE
jgi:cytochrome c oxidase cbb3-type subunit IV